MLINYKNYFSKHYMYSFDKNEIESYKNWFYPQWKTIQKYIKEGKYKSCLEIGSSIGGFYQFIKEEIPYYKGIELDVKAVKFANKYWGCNYFHNIPFEKLQNEKFNLIFAFEVLEHVENPNKIINKIFTFLNQEGVFIGTTPYPTARAVKGDETHLFVLHPENWKRLFLLNGFKKVVLLPMTFMLVIWKINKLLNIRIPYYLPFPGFISTCMIIAWK